MVLLVVKSKKTESHARALISLDDEGGGVGRLILEVGWEHLGQAVVTREAVDAGLDENETELGVLVLQNRRAQRQRKGSLARSSMLL